MTMRGSNLTIVPLVYAIVCVIQRLGVERFIPRFF